MKSRLKREFGRALLRHSSLCASVPFVMTKSAPKNFEEANDLGLSSSHRESITAIQVANYEDQNQPIMV